MSSIQLLTFANDGKSYRASVAFGVVEFPGQPTPPRAPYNKAAGNFALGFLPGGSPLTAQVTTLDSNVEVFYSCAPKAAIDLVLAEIAATAPEFRDDAFIRSTLTSLSPFQFIPWTNGVVEPGNGKADFFEAPVTAVLLVHTAVPDAGFGAPGAWVHLIAS